MSEWPGLSLKALNTQKLRKRSISGRRGSRPSPEWAGGPRAPPAPEQLSSASHRGHTCAPEINADEAETTPGRHSFLGLRNPISRAMGTGKKIASQKTQWSFVTRLRQHSAGIEARKTQGHAEAGMRALKPVGWQAKNKKPHLK